MKRKNTTRNALVTSIISVLLCVSMLVGTTFAWFTDEVKSGVNTIAAGNLDVELYHGKDANPVDKVTEGTMLFTDVGGNVIDQWEPGVVAFTNLKVANVGTLALKYQLSINSTEMNYVEGTDLTLADALQVAVVEGGVSGTREQVIGAVEASAWTKLESFTLPGVLEADKKSETYGIVIYWEPGANEHDNQFNMNNGKTTSDGEPLTITLGVNLFATQEMYEDDSFGPDYDENAWDKAMKVYSEQDLNAAIANGETAIMLMDDIDLTETLEIPANATLALNLNGKSLGGNIEIPAGAKLTVGNGTIANTDSGVSGIQNNGGELVLDNVTVESARHGVRVEGGNVTINSGEFIVAPTSNMTVHALNVSDGATVTINGGTFVGPKGTIADSGSAVCVQAGSTVIINGGNFSGGKNSTLATKEGANLTVKGGIFDQDPSAYVATGYHAVENNGLYYVVPENVDKIVTTRDELQKALDDATGDYTIALAADITGDVIVTQKEGVNITIDGYNHEYDGSIEIYGQARHDGDETLTIKNINFVADEARDFVHCNTTESAKRYAHNVIIEGCTFTSTTTEDVVAARFRQCYNITIKDCEATGLHSVLWATGVSNGLVIDGVTATCMSGGVSVGTSASVTVKNSDITVSNEYGYGVRADASGVYSLTVENCTITADAPVLVRKATGNATVTLNGNTLNSAKGNTVVVTAADYEEGKELTAPTGKITLTIDGATQVKDADALVEVLENGKDVVLTNSVKIDPASMSNAYGTTGINVKNGQTIDGGGNTLDIKGAGGTWDSGINTTGGVIKNITVTGSFRGIFINHNSSYSERVVLENVTIQGTTYTISCDQGTNQGLTATKSTFKGWTSYAATLGDAKFVECYFGEGNGYAYCRPYAPTEFVGCDFEAGFEMDPRAAVTFENCTIGGIALTAENLATLVTSNIANATVK